MFVLKVEWKKRIIVGLLNIIPMLALTIAFTIICIQHEVIDGLVAIVICNLVYLLGIKDILFFEIDKSRRLDYMGGKVEDKWKQSSVAILIRATTFAILVFYFIITLISIYKVKGA